MSVLMPPELHKRIRVAAAERDSTMNAVIVAGVDAYLNAKGTVEHAPPYGSDGSR